MVIELNPNWRKIVKKPRNWIDEFSDEAMIKIVPVATPNNPILIMVGKDVFTDGYYVVVEDNDVSDDIYPENGESLYDCFMRVYNKHVQVDELLTELFNASVEANVKLTFTDENGKTDRADLLQALNRLSSAVYILMIRTKAQTDKR